MYVDSFPCAQSYPPGSVVTGQTPLGLSGRRGMGCACGGTCGGCSHGVSGLTFDGTGLFGTGLFPGGWDLSTWGGWEWGTVAAGVYLLFSTFYTTRAGVRGVRSGVRRTRQRIGKRVAGSGSRKKAA